MVNANAVFPFCVNVDDHVDDHDVMWCDEVIWYDDGIDDDDVDDDAEVMLGESKYNELWMPEELYWKKQSVTDIKILSWMTLWAHACTAMVAWNIFTHTKSNK